MTDQRFVECKCGCGTLLPEIDKNGRYRKFAHGHQNKKPYREISQIPCKCGCGTMIDSIDTKNRPRSFVPGHSARMMTPAQLAHHMKLREYRKDLTSWNKGKKYILAKKAVYATTGAWQQAIKNLYGDRCMRCDWQAAPCDVHHIAPKSKGGKHTIENGIILCPNCHRIVETGGIPNEEITRLRAAAVPLIEVR